jgi:hypothetical protein
VVDVNEPRRICDGWVGSVGRKLCMIYPTCSEEDWVEMKRIGSDFLMVVRDCVNRMFSDCRIRCGFYDSDESWYELDMFRLSDRIGFSWIGPDLIRSVILFAEADKIRR